MSNSTTLQRQNPAEDLAYLLLALFAGTTHAYAEQLPSGGYNAIRETVPLEAVLDHLEGRRTIGLYQVAPDGTAKATIFDLDLRKATFEAEGLSDRLKQQLKGAAGGIRGEAEELGLKVLTAFSGRKGIHLYVLFGVASLAEDVIALADHILGAAGWEADTPDGCGFSHPDFPEIHCERFPKQSEIEPGGLGSLVKLPCGVHRVTQRKSYFLDQRWNPVKDPLGLLEACVPDVQDAKASRE